MTGENWILEDSRYMRLHKLRRDAFQILSHSHPYWQLIVVTAGELTVSTAAERFDVAASEVHIPPPGQPHALESTAGYVQLGIDLWREHPLTRLLESSFPVPAVISVRHSGELVARMDGYCPHMAVPLTCARVCNLAEALVLDCIEALGTSSADRWAEELTAYLDENLEKPLSLSQIAARFYLSVPQLERRCRRSYHCGVIARLQQRRFHRAKLLLMNTELSVQQVGTAVGYPEPSHFSGFFRKLSGVSPRAYRAENV